MAIYKEISQHSSKGICFTNGAKLTGWNVAFGMPYKVWDTGSVTYADGFVSSRLTETSSYNLSTLYHGQEVIMADVLWRYCVTNGSCLNGSGRQYSKLKSPTGVDTWWFNGGIMNINIQATDPGWMYQFYQGIGVAGIDEFDEFHTNGTLCLLACATMISGDNISIPTSQCNITATNTPSLTDLNCCGVVWVEGNDLYYSGARGWEHFLVGVCQSGAAAANRGAIWVDTTHAPSNHYLNWVGNDCNVYRAQWSLCQFCTSFYSGPGTNPAPGASFKGAIWADKENGGGWVNLAYIGCDGNKYLIAHGNLPDSIP